MTPLLLTASLLLVLPLCVGFFLYAVVLLCTRWCRRDANMASAINPRAVMFIQRRSSSDRVAQTASIALCALLLTGCVYAPETVRIVNASGERLTSVEVSVSGREWRLSDVSLGEVRELGYRAGWFEPTYDVQVEYEMGGSYAISLHNSTLDSATFIIGKQAYDLSYSNESMPRIEGWIADIEASRPRFSERQQRVTGLSGAETTLHTFRKGSAIQMLEMAYKAPTVRATKTFYLGADERLLAVTRREQPGDSPAKWVETFYFGPTGALQFYRAAAPPEDPQDTVLIDASYELQYLERFLDAAKRPDDVVRVDWITRE